MGNHAPRTGSYTDLLVRELAGAVAPRMPFYAMRVLPRAGRKLIDHLEGYGFSPLALRFVPGFLFLRFHPAQRLQLSAIPGVHSIVGFAAQPFPVDEEELEALRRVQDSRLPVGPAPFPAAGTPCRVLAGPLEGIRGIRPDGADARHLILSLTLLQRSIAVEVDPSWLGPYRPVHVSSSKGKSL